MQQVGQLQAAVGRIKTGAHEPGFAKGVNGLFHFRDDVHLLAVKGRFIGIEFLGMWLELLFRNLFYTVQVDLYSQHQ